MQYNSRDRASTPFVRKRRDSLWKTFLSHLIMMTKCVNARGCSLRGIVRNTKKKKHYTLLFNQHGIAIDWM